MKLVLWNCNSGIGKKEQIDFLLRFQPDIAVIPEMRESNIKALKPNDAEWITNNHKTKSPKGLGVITYNGYELKPVERDNDMEIFLPLIVSKANFQFNLLAVWNFYYACKQGRFKGVKGPSCLEFEALKHYKNFLSANESIVAGDWNLGPTFAQSDFLEVCRLLADSGLDSLYHKSFNLKVNESEHRTFRRSQGQLHHLDHIFGSGLFSQSIKSYIIPPLSEVILSDHSPVVVEFSIVSNIKTA